MQVNNTNNNICCSIIVFGNSLKSLTHLTAHKDRRPVVVTGFSASWNCIGLNKLSCTNEGVANFLKFSSLVDLQVLSYISLKLFA